MAKVNRTNLYIKISPNHSKAQKYRMKFIINIHGKFYYRNRFILKSKLKQIKTKLI
jgi:hypothetical protein